MWKKIAIGLLVVFALMQFIRPDYATAPVDPRSDYLSLQQPPTDVAQIIEGTCYDCHSNQTDYPWYSQVAPVSWIIADHVEHGKEHLNFSNWAGYDAEKKAHKLEECAEEVREGEMPLKGYVVLHNNARLGEEQRNRLAAWFEQPMRGAMGMGSEHDETEDHEHDDHEGHEH